ncbi:hypothetical protein RNJ44_01125 [Nakaseomyces bracarensis]|uniref:BRCT domain-containing protein n=1 Tax=Nakaseomyces bracarensis TaxID=273131 RepID=A0ABR4NR90_9SACH
MFAGLKILFVSDNSNIIKWATEVGSHGDTNTVLYTLNDPPPNGPFVTFDSNLDQVAEDVLDCNSVDVVISDTTDFSQYSLFAFEYMIPVVTSQWITDCITTGKLVKMFQRYSPDVRHVLKDSRIYLSPVLEVNPTLRQLLQDVAVTLGSCLRDFISEKTTHIVVMSQEDPIIRELESNSVLKTAMDPSLEIVEYQWLLKCFRAQRKLDANESASQFKSTGQLFESMRFNIAPNIMTNLAIEPFLVEFIESEGGQVVEKKDDTVYSIGDYNDRNGQANITWLFHMWTMGNYTSLGTRNKLLGGFGFENDHAEAPAGTISYTGIWGELRRWYITRIIEWTGFSFSATNNADVLISLSKPDQRSNRKKMQEFQGAVCNPHFVIDALANNARTDPSNYRSLSKRRLFPAEEPSAGTQPKRRNVRNEHSGQPCPTQIRAVCTNCLKDLTQRDKRALRERGVQIVDEVTPLVNAVIAPRRVKTEKFLKALAKPLLYILKPSFVEELLGRPEGELDIDSLATQHLLDVPLCDRRNLFQGAGIYAVNLVNDIPVGTDQIKAILEYYGLHVQVLPTRFSLQDLTINEATLTKNPDINNKDTEQYILVAHRRSQVHRLSKLVKEQTSLVVQWDWIVHCIFTGQVSRTAKTEGILS